MTNPYLETLCKNHPYFKEIISCYAPIGYNEKLKAFVSWLEDFNRKNNCNICFSQIKMKFGFLTIYVHDANLKDETIPLFQKETELVHKVYEKIAEMCYEVQKICDICGKDLIESVCDSRVVWVCFDHPQQNHINLRRK